MKRGTEEYKERGNMKEINIMEAIQMPQLMIDMVTPVKDYEKYDFHVGMKLSLIHISEPTRRS